MNPKDSNPAPPNDPPPEPDFVEPLAVDDEGAYDFGADSEMDGRAWGLVAAAVGAGAALWTALSVVSGPWFPQIGGVVAVIGATGVGLFAASRDGEPWARWQWLLGGMAAVFLIGRVLAVPLTPATPIERHADEQKGDMSVALEMFDDLALGARTGQALRAIADEYGEVPPRADWAELMVRHGLSDATDPAAVSVDELDEFDEWHVPVIEALLERQEALAAGAPPKYPDALFYAFFDLLFACVGLIIADRLKAGDWV